MANADRVKQPWFGGARSVAEQMMGLEAALAEARGKSVLDLGCAEGAISFAFARGKAGRVRAMDYNASMIAQAQAEQEEIGVHNLSFEVADFSDWIADPRALWGQFDIVLALAVLHKLSSPAAGAAFCADVCASLLVIRFPKGSSGRIRAKQHPHDTADVPKILTSKGFVRERKEVGPRGEWVQYWRRK